MSSVSWVATRSFLIRYVIALVIGMIGLGATVSFVNHEVNTRVSHIERINLKLADAPPEGANYLIIGSDTRADASNAQDIQAVGSAADVGGQRSDTLMVAHVEPAAKRTLVVSFPRDLLVKFRDGRTHQINEAYSDGGPQAVIDMLDFNWGIPISHYVEIGFESFRDIVNTIGQVSVWFPYAAHDTESGLLMPAGCDPLDGANALAYVRSRYLQYNLGGRGMKGFAVNPGEVQDRTVVDVFRDAPDLYRIDRQQAFTRALAAVAIDRSLGNPFTALDLADSVLQNTKVDQKLSRADVNGLVRAFRTVDVNDPSALELTRVPTKVNPVDPNRLALDQPAADAVLNRLKAFGSTPPPPSVLPGQVRVTVLDGTGRNLDVAGALATLQGQGFVPVRSGVAATRSDITQIQYRARDRAKALLLTNYFEDAAVVQVADDAFAGDEVQVVLGGTFGFVTVPSAAPVTTAPAPVTPAGPAASTPPLVGQYQQPAPC